MPKGSKRGRKPKAQAPDETPEVVQIGGARRGRPSRSSKNLKAAGSETVSEVESQASGNYHPPKRAGTGIAVPKTRRLGDP